MSKKLWGGRFKKSIDKEFFSFQKSIQYDYKLAQYDIYHSLIHVSALKEAGLLKAQEASKLTAALKDIYREIRDKKFKPALSAEDIHTDIQNRVSKKAGKVALKLHTLRSRNDQIVFDERWYCYKEGVTILKLLNGVLSSLNFLSSKYKHCYIPGYTHTQRAQVVSFMNYSGAYFNMFERDFERVDKFLKDFPIYLGSGALAGSGISRKAYTEAIEFFLDKTRVKGSQYKLGIAKNTLDNVANRDFIVEFLSILSLLQMHLSRMAEDFILYSTQEFAFFDLPEEYCTGSSLMPHKKNPDFLELVRGSTGKVYGNLVSILTLMKGLPLTYNRDMQLDKEPLFSSVEVIESQLQIMIDFIKKVELREDKLAKALEDETLYATELAEFLVFKGVAFKDAHTIVGKMVRASEDEQVLLKEMTDKKLKTFHPQLSHKEIVRIMNPHYAVTSKKSLSAEGRAEPVKRKSKGK